MNNSISTTEAERSTFEEIKIWLDCQLNYPQNILNFCKGAKISINYLDTNKTYHAATIDSAFKKVSHSEELYQNKPRSQIMDYTRYVNYYIDGNEVDDFTYYKVLYFFKQAGLLDLFPSSLSEDLELYESISSFDWGKYYNIVVLDNGKLGDEIFLDVKTNEEEAEDFIRNYDRSQIPEGYKIKYYKTQKLYTIWIDEKTKTN